jgi:fructoselysine-6-P-deglycase FrlB-like protein
MTLDRHTAAFPELRGGPPWVMEEMIHAQAALPERIADAEAAHAVHDLMSRLRDAGEEIVVTGCGTSEHAAMAIAALLNDAAADASGQRQPVRARQALDVALDRPTRGLVIAISHDGGTRATLLALEGARAAGAATAAITARADSAVASAADLVLVTPTLDRSWCHTVAYTSAILAGAAIAYADATTSWSTTSEATIAAGLADGRAREAGRRLYPARRVVTAGMGADLIAARELALKIEEGARIPATAHHLETLLHGHLAACEPTDTRIVLVASDRSLGDRHQRRLRLAAGAVAQDLADGFPEHVDLVTLPATGSETFSCLAGILASAVGIQLMTLGLVDAARTNPDLIRREDAPYRAAAAVGDESAGW